MHGETIKTIKISFTGVLHFSWNYCERSVEKEGKRKIN